MLPLNCEDHIAYLPGMDEQRSTCVCFVWLAPISHWIFCQSRIKHLTARGALLSQHSGSILKLILPIFIWKPKMYIDQAYIFTLQPQGWEFGDIEQSFKLHNLCNFSRAKSNVSAITWTGKCFCELALSYDISFLTGSLLTCYPNFYNLRPPGNVMAQDSVAGNWFPLFNPATKGKGYFTSSVITGIVLRPCVCLSSVPNPMSLVYCVSPGWWTPSAW